MIHHLRKKKKKKEMFDGIGGNMFIFTYMSDPKLAKILLCTLWGWGAPKSYS